MTPSKLVENAPEVRGIFCGHIHHVFEGIFAGSRFYSAPSASFQFAPASAEATLDPRPPGFRVLELQETGFRTRIVRLHETPFLPRDE